MGAMILKIAYVAPYMWTPKAEGRRLKAEAEG